MLTESGTLSGTAEVKGSVVQGGSSEHSCSEEGIWSHVGGEPLPSMHAPLLVSGRAAPVSVLRAADRLSHAGWQNEGVAAVTGWFGNLANTVSNTVVQSLDSVSHVADGDQGAPAQSNSRNAPPPSKGARHRSELEQRAYELKVSAACRPPPCAQRAPAPAAHAPLARVFCCTRPCRAGACRAAVQGLAGRYSRIDLSGG